MIYKNKIENIQFVYFFSSKIKCRTNVNKPHFLVYVAGHHTMLGVAVETALKTAKFEIQIIAL